MAITLKLALAPVMTVASCGWLVMAGLLARHVAPLQAAYGDWITLSAVGEREGWVCLAGQRPRH